MGSQPESRVASTYLAFVISKQNGNIVHQEKCDDVRELRDRLNEMSDGIVQSEDEDRLSVDWTLVTNQELEGEEEDE